jgi:hypothetical protein
MTEATEVTLSILDSHFHVTSEDPQMGELVRQLWEPFVTTASVSAATAVPLRSAAGTWRFCVPPDPPSSAEDPWVFAAVLRNFLSGRAVRAARSVVPLHGAAVERDGTFLVLSGAPRSGKTTLVLELLDRGWTYVTDDLIPVRRGGLTARPFPKPLSVREPDVWRRFAARWPVPAWLPPPRTVGLVPASAFPMPEEREYTPSVLVFPRFSPGAEPELEELSPAAATALAGDNLHAGARDPAMLATLATLGKSAPAYGASYGSTGAALELLERALRGRKSME